MDDALEGDVPMTREELKRDCLALLDRAAIEHPVGHQGKLAARYVLRTAQENRIELMFEKGPSSPANLWVAKEFAAGLMDLHIAYRMLPGSPIGASLDDGTKRAYERHAALKPMRQLATADLVCFRIETEDQLRQILACLMRQ